MSYNRSVSNNFIQGKLITKAAPQHPETIEDVVTRQKWLTEVGVKSNLSTISISTRESLAVDKRLGLVPDYLDYQRLQYYAESSVKSHRLEQLAAYALRELGLDASAVPTSVNGRTEENLHGDIIVNYKGQQLAVEVKENRRAWLGLPKDEHDRLGLNGYKRQPRQLWCDSVLSYNTKFRYHLQQKQLLSGVVVLCSIAELSDEENTCYGLLWLHGNVNEWNKRTCHNPYKGTTYAAYEAKGEQIQPLSTIIQSLDGSVDFLNNLR